MGELSREEKRKYALALRRVDYGIWGYKGSLFRVITLTTRAGDDNGTKRMGKDVRKLIAWFRKLGYKVEYCGVYELSKKRGLLHWHGILRVKGGFFQVYEGEYRKGKGEHARGNRRALGDKWNEIHNAFAVDLEVVRNMKYLERYINKHMVKDYLSEGIIRNKFLVSGGWMRKGIKELVADYKNWWVNATGDIWVSKAGWLLLKSLVRGWCERKDIRVGNTNGYFGLSDGRIVSEIYISED